MHTLVSSYRASLVIAIMAAAYLLPTLIAWLRHAPDIVATAVVNIALGWTVIGWILALAMGLRNANPAAVQVFSQVNTPASPPLLNGCCRASHYGFDPRQLPSPDAETSHEWGAATGLDRWPHNPSS